MENNKSNSYFWRSVRGELPIPAAAKTLGASFVTIDPELGKVEMKFEGKPEFVNPIGNIQGGFLCAMLDDVMGPAIVCTLEEGFFAPTIDLQVQFLRPATVGIIQGFGVVEKRGRDIAFLSGELHQEGKLIAKASASAMIKSGFV